MRGGCLSFDGVDDWVNAGNGGSMNATSAITIGGWVKSNSSSQSWCTVIGKGFEKNANYSFRANSNWIGVIIGNGTTYNGTGSYVPTVGQWFHMVGVLTTINNTTKINVYINGTFLQTATIAWPLTTSEASFGIGHSYSYNYWSGLIDDVRIYNRALSAQEIQAIYSATN
jgi:hypothetical protein